MGNFPDMESPGVPGLPLDGPYMVLPVMGGHGGS